MSIDHIGLTAGYRDRGARPSSENADELYARHVNPQWVKLFNTLE